MDIFAFVHAKWGYFYAFRIIIDSNICNIISNKYKENGKFVLYNDFKKDGDELA